MKKSIVLLLGMIFAFHLSACGETGLDKENGGDQEYFNAAVLEVYDDHLLVECLDITTGVVSAGEEAEVSTEVVAAAGVPEIAAGDNIRVVFGATEDTIPIHVGNVFAIYLLDENGVPIGLD